MISNRFKIILLATVFNLAFEYSLRGSNILLTKPHLFVTLVFGYFTLYAMAEDLIVRFKLKDYQIALFTAIYMMVYMGFMTGVLFDNPYFLGINPVNLVFVGVLWSGIIQGSLTFYFANRIQTRNWNHPRMGKAGWSVCLIITAVVWVLHYFGNPYKAQGTTPGYLIWGICETSLIVWLYLSIKTKSSKEERKFVSSPILDFLASGTFFIFIFSALFLTSGQMISVATHINRPALIVVNLWTFVLSTILIIYRLKRKESIPI